MMNLYFIFFFFLKKQHILTIILFKIEKNVFLCVIFAKNKTKISIFNFTLIVGIINIKH